MIRRTFPHPQPNLDVIADAIRGEMGAAGPQGFYVMPGPGGVTIEQLSWDGVDERAVAVAIAATPPDSPALRNRRDADMLPPVLKEALLALLDLVNIERAQHGRGEIAPAQFIAAVKARL